MDRSDAVLIISQGITFRELRDVMLHEYDGKPAKTINDFTRSEAFTLLRGCINGQNGMVDPRSHYGLAAQLILREFAPDLDN